MLKEIFAISLLAGLLIGVIINVGVLRKLTEDIVERVDEAAALAEAGEWEEAEAIAETAKQRWTEAGGYTHIVLRHPEIDKVTSSFHDLMLEIYARDKEKVAGESRALKEHIGSIYRMEEIGLSNIF